MRICENGQARSRFPTWFARASKAGVARPRRVWRRVAPGEAVPAPPGGGRVRRPLRLLHRRQEIPEDRLAPVYSDDALGSFVAIPLAQATVGPLSAAIGVHTTLLGAAVVILGGTVAMLAVRDVRALRIRTASPATGLVSAPVSAAA